MKNHFLILLFWQFSASGFSQYSIEEKSSSGPCISYSLKDSKGLEIHLPEHAKNAFACSPNAPLVSAVTGILFYFYENEIFALEIAKGVAEKIATLSKETRGLSNFIVNENQNCLAFVSITQDSNLVAKTFLSAILLQGSKKNMDWIQEMKLNFSCDETCYSIAGRDFWFEENNTIGYFVWNHKPYDNEGAGREKYWKLF